MPHAINLEQAYDKATVWWPKSISKMGVPAAYDDFIRRACPPGPIKSMIDAGTGCGDLAIAVCTVKGAPAELTLIDTSVNMLGQAAPRFTSFGSSLKCHHGSIFDVEITTQADLVLAGHLVEHCADPQLAIRRLADFTRPGGSLLMIISRPHWCNWLIWLRWRHRWFKPHQIKSWGQNVGLETPTVFSLRYGSPKRTSLGYSFRKTDSN
jgi:ubiquinone/menaquinone biosynthesis C-methylase UbiE